MSQTSSTISESLVKFYVPKQLKNQLKHLANERSLTLSALMRLIASDYIKLKQ